MKTLSLFLFILFHIVQFSAQERTDYLKYMAKSLPDTYAKSNANLFFTVQIAALSKKNRSLDSLKNINIYKEKDNLIKYRLGEFTTYKNAVEFKKMLRSVCRDAFIVPIKNGKRIHIKQALKEVSDIL